MSLIVIDRSPFESTYLPKKLLHRENEMEHLKRLYRPLTEISPTAVRAVLIGPKGSGKTSLSRMLTQWFILNRPSASGFVINCRIEGSEYGVLMRAMIMARMTRRFIRGISIEEALMSFIESLEKAKEPVLMALDDVDSLLIRKHTYLLYALLRIHERSTSAANKLGILMTMKELPSYMLNDTFQDISLLPTLKLRAYTEEELSDIIEDRARLGLRQSSYDGNSIALIAHSAMPSGDARYAIEVLLRAATISESEGLDRILPDHVRKALSILPSFPSESDLLSLDETQRDVLTSVAISLCENDDIYVTMGKIEREYRRFVEEKGKEPISHTRLWEALLGLERAGFIKRSVKSFGKRGRTTVVYLIPPAMAIRRILEENDL